MPDSPETEVVSKPHPVGDSGRENSSPYSIRELVDLLHRRLRFFAGTVAGLLSLCLIYCMIAPNQYEASAEVALRMQSGSSLTLDAAETMAPEIGRAHV